MGQNVDKMDTALMQTAPLEDDIVKGLHYVSDAYRLMKMTVMVCDKITKHNRDADKHRTVLMKDLGTVLVAAGKSLTPDDIFSKILISFGETQLNLAQFETNWLTEIENSLVKPIFTLLDENSGLLGSMKNRMMILRLNIHKSKQAADSKNKIMKLEHEYDTIKQEARKQIAKEKKAIDEIKDNIIHVMEKQLENYKRSAQYLSDYTNMLKSNPNAVNILEVIKHDDMERELFNVYKKYKAQMDKAQKQETEIKIPINIHEEVKQLSADKTEKPPKTWTRGTLFTKEDVNIE